MQVRVITRLLHYSLEVAADEDMDLENLDDFGSKKKKKKKNRKLDDLADEDEDKENAGDESSGE